MVEILERGDIAFFYRPRVQPAGALDHVPGVQSFFFVLGPAGGGRHRRLRIGRKRMPAASGQRFWASVERVGSLERVLAGELEDEHYTTKTRGDRFQPGARLIARGCYAIVRHDDHSHLAYRVDQIEPEEDLPEEVRIAPAGSYVLLYERRPRTRATWTTEGEPARLDEPDAELVLVGVDDDPERELGIDLLAG
jgi:hypothetical protein